MTPQSARVRSRRRRVGIALGVLVAVLVAVAVVAMARLAGVADTLERARSELDVASTAVREGRIADALDSLERAELGILDANETLRTAPELRILSFLPVVTQNLDSLEDSVEAAAVVVHGGERILRTSSPLQTEGGTLQVSLSDGSLPIEQVERARTEIRALSTQLATPAGEASALLLPMVRDLHEDVRQEIALRQDELGLSLIHI